jgi:hypothetical protein
LLLTKFFDSISKMVPGDPLSGRVEAIAKLNPDKIYVENVRSALGVSTGKAQQICETAVRQGVFDRYVEVLCPDGAVAACAKVESQLPAKVSCWTEREGELEEVEIPTNALAKTTFYRFVK